MKKFIFGGILGYGDSSEQPFPQGIVTIIDFDDLFIHLLLLFLGLVPLLALVVLLLLPVLDPQLLLNLSARLHGS